MVSFLFIVFVFKLEGRLWGHSEICPKTLATLGSNKEGEKEGQTDYRLRFPMTKS